MSASIGHVGCMPLKSTVFKENKSGDAGQSLEIMRRQLVDAQVEVLRMYLEKRSRDQLLEALDRLIECTSASFDEEEALMECLAPALDPGHREMHSRVLAQLIVLRNSAMDFDRGRLLAQLILIDRQLTSHLSDAARISAGQQRNEGVEGNNFNGLAAANPH